MSILFSDFLNLSKEVTQALKQTGFLPDINGESVPSSGASSLGNVSKKSDASNCQITNDQQQDKSDDQETIEDDEEEEEAKLEEEEPKPGPSGIQSYKRSREDKAAELYKKHMRTLQFDTSSMSVTGPQVNQLYVVDQLRKFHSTYSILRHTTSHLSSTRQALLARKSSLGLPKSSHLSLPHFRLTSLLLSLSDPMTTKLHFSER